MQLAELPLQEAPPSFLHMLAYLRHKEDGSPSACRASCIWYQTQSNCVTQYPCAWQHMSGRLRYTEQGSQQRLHGSPDIDKSAIS